MGTRNLVAVIADGQYKVAQYGQWDGYPSGQGKTALSFLRAADLDVFRKQLDRCRFVTPEQVEAWYQEVGADGSGWVSMDVSARFTKKHPYINRDIGAKVLEMIYKSKAKAIDLTDNHEFAGDSLFCEWAYVIDLDLRTFEVYKGFNTEPVPAGERFAAFKPQDERRKEYYPVRHVVTFSLDTLPDDAEFLERTEDVEETV